MVGLTSLRRLRRRAVGFAVVPAGPFLAVLDFFVISFAVPGIKTGLSALRTERGHRDAVMAQPRAYPNDDRARYRTDSASR